MPAIFKVKQTKSKKESKSKSLFQHQKERVRLAWNEMPAREEKTQNLTELTTSQEIFPNVTEGAVLWFI